MPNFRQFWLAAATAGLVLVAGCNQGTKQSANQSAKQPTKQPMKAAPAAVKQAPAPKAVPVSAKVTTQPAQLITVPKNTAITATVSETLTSDKSHPGDAFGARISTPVSVDGKVVLAKGTHVTGRVVKVKKNEVKVALASIVVQGKSYDLETNSVREPEKSQAKNAGKANGAAKNAKTQLTFKLAKPVSIPVKG